MATNKPIVYGVSKETIEQWERELLDIAQPREFYNEDFEAMKTQIISNSSVIAKKIINQIKLIKKNHVE